MPVLFDEPLRGAGGEPVSFARTIYSHGCAELPPASIEQNPLTYRRAFRAGARVVDVLMRERNGRLVGHTASTVSGRHAGEIAAAIARMFRLSDDLSPFYAQIAGDPALAWAANGAGRILAGPTVFEDVVKTICTTNCSWSATIRMTRALSEFARGAFPEAQRLATAPDDWYRDAARMGYRGAYVKRIAQDVAARNLDLEALRDARYADADVERMLLDLPGIGPYGAAHVMQLLGRHQALVLDSWTRPKYRRLAGKKQATDTTIRRAFARYGRFAGLAFWLYLTRDWLEDT